MLSTRFFFVLSALIKPFTICTVQRFALSILFGYERDTHSTNHKNWMISTEWHHFYLYHSPHYRSLNMYEWMYSTNTPTPLVRIRTRYCMFFSILNFLLFYQHKLQTRKSSTLNHDQSISFSKLLCYFKRFSVFFSKNVFSLCFYFPCFQPNYYCTNTNK